MNRFVRQLSKTTGKKVSFVMEGGESEIDKSLLFQLASPLEQLLRNALDHGIETPEERLAMGKAPEGLLRLKASHQAGSFLLEVEDDGSGLDMEKLRQKGADLDIFSAGEKVNPVRVMEMIFKPGVTTVENPSAGQGAGLDQVEEKMEDLHGSIRVQSRAGQGCKFVLKIPRTQALIEGLVVEAGQKKYLMPLSQVRKISHPTPLKAEDEKEVSRAAGPAPVELAQFLGEERRPGVAQFTLHVESGSHQAQVLVDEVHGKQQVLVKKMDEEGKKTGLRGAVVLADGKLGWILDMRLLVQSAGQDERRKEDSHGKSDQK
jgi:two-component system chemotaxis sensor kinase CheA